MSYVWQMKDSAHCGVVSGGDGLSCHPSAVEMGFSSSRWPGLCPALLLLPPSDLLGLFGG